MLRDGRNGKVLSGADDASRGCGPRLTAAQKAEGWRRGEQMALVARAKVGDRKRHANGARAANSRRTGTVIRPDKHRVNRERGSGKVGGGEKHAVRGMRQVYQATDTTLNRQVALKILPEAFASDPERLARFKRKAFVESKG